MISLMYYSYFLAKASLLAKKTVSVERNTKSKTLTHLTEDESGVLFKVKLHPNDQKRTLICAK